MIISNHPFVLRVRAATKPLTIWVLNIAIGIPLILLLCWLQETHFYDAVIMLHQFRAYLTALNRTQYLKIARSPNLNRKEGS